MRAFLLLQSKQRRVSSTIQGKNVDLILDLIDKSHDKNIGFLHTVDSYEEMSKMEVIRNIRKSQA